MSNAEKACRAMLIKMVADGDNTATILGAAIRFGLMCGDEDEQYLAGVAHSAVMSAIKVETKGPKQ